MFTLLYSFRLYRFWKSGMLLDFFFKKIVYYKLKFIFNIYTIKFSEKYYIEYNFLRINKYILVLKNTLNYFTTKIIIHYLLIIFVFMILSLIFLLI